MGNKTFCEYDSILFDWICTFPIFILVKLAKGLGWAFISTRRSCWSIIVQFIQVFLYWAFSMLLVIICWNKWKYWLYVITSDNLAQTRHRYIEKLILHLLSIMENISFPTWSFRAINRHFKMRFSHRCPLQFVYIRLRGILSCKVVAIKVSIAETV